MLLYASGGRGYLNVMSASGGRGYLNVTVCLC